MSVDSEIVVVSGLPRSGTSLMMQMLDQGGVPALTDTLRAADTDNPRGYFEYEPVKNTKADPSWLPQARGKAVKMVSSLLYDLPPTESYRVLFMERDLDEVLASQEKMLLRLGRAAAPRDQIRDAFQVHLRRLCQWLPQQPHLQVLRVCFNRLVSDPPLEVQAVADFLDGRPAVAAMLAAIDTTLYRNRRG